MCFLLEIDRVNLLSRMCMYDMHELHFLLILSLWIYMMCNKYNSIWIQVSQLTYDLVEDVPPSSTVVNIRQHLSEWWKVFRCSFSCCSWLLTMLTMFVCSTISCHFSCSWAVNKTSVLSKTFPGFSATICFILMLVLQRNMNTQFICFQ